MPKTTSVRSSCRDRYLSPTLSWCCQNNVATHMHNGRKMVDHPQCVQAYLQYQRGRGAVAARQRMIRSSRALRSRFSGLGAPQGYTGQPPYCGSPELLQQMLYDMGYYAGPIDGDFGTNSMRAMATFKREEGLGSGVVVAHDCERLNKRWNDKMITSGQVDPKDLPSTDRPLPKEFYTRLHAMQRVSSSGQQQMDQDLDVDLDSSMFDNSSSNGGVVAKTKSWWEEQSTVTKVAIVGGGIAAVGGVLYVATR